MKSERTNTGHP